MKFVKKPVVIDAERITTKQEIETREGKLYAYPGDWIITGIKGEKYPCDNEIFRETYEPVDPTGIQLSWDTYDKLYPFN